MKINKSRVLKQLDKMEQISAQLGIDLIWAEIELDSYKLSLYRKSDYDSKHFEAFIKAKKEDDLSDTDKENIRLYDKYSDMENY